MRKTHFSGSILWEEHNFRGEHFEENTFLGENTLRGILFLERKGKNTKGRTLLVGRTLLGEHFLKGEHFGENTFWEENTLGRTLLEGRTLWGEHFFEGEHFGENTFFLLMKLHFDEGRTREPTVITAIFRKTPTNYSLILKNIILRLMHYG